MLRLLPDTLKSAEHGSLAAAERTYIRVCALQTSAWGLAWYIACYSAPGVLNVPHKAHTCIVCLADAGILRHNGRHCAAFQVASLPQPAPTRNGVCQECSADVLPASRSPAVVRSATIESQTMCHRFWLPTPGHTDLLAVTAGDALQQLQFACFKSSGQSRGSVAKSRHRSTV